MKWSVPIEGSLYLYAIIYPVYIFGVKVGDLLVEIILNPSKFRTETAYAVTVSCLLLSVITLMYLSTALLVYTFRKRQFWSLRLFFVLHITFYTLISELRAVADQYGVTKRHSSYIGVIANIFCRVIYVFYGANLLYLIEKLKTEHGIPPSKTIFCVHIHKLMKGQVAFVSIRQLLFLMQDINLIIRLDKNNLSWLPHIIFQLGFTLMHTSLIFMLITAYKRRDPKQIQMYKVLHAFATIIYTLSIRLLLFSFHKEPRPTIDSMIEVVSCNICILELYLMFLCRESFKNPTKVNLEVLQGIRELKKFLKRNNIPQVYVNIMEGEKGCIGFGHFGAIQLGTLTSMNKTKINPLESTVAVKFIKPGIYFEEVLTSLMSELKILSAIGKGHENLTKFYGVTFNKYSADAFFGGCGIGITMEYYSNGSIEKYLRDRTFDKRKSFFHLEKFKMWALQIASAMSFLADAKIIHGDLSARNVLLDHNQNAKVADFGMAQRLYYYQLYVTSNQTLFPWRWMSPESLLDLEFSIQSDVYSYGIILWEIYSLGSVPWFGLEWNSEFLYLLKAGTKLAKPELAPSFIYNDIMLHCWHVNREKRPSFKEIIKLLSPTNDYITNT